MSKLILSAHDLEALTNFDSLPNAAFVRAPVVARLMSCHVNTVWRHSKEGLLPEPKKFSPQFTGWNVGELRLALKQEAGA